MSAGNSTNLGSGPLGKIVNLRVSPVLWANLSFEVGGIVGQSNVTLGQNVTHFDFTSFYATLGVATEEVSIPFNPGLTGHVRAQLSFRQPEPENLLDAQDIQNGTSASTLMALRAEPVKAVLDKACAVRANAYFGRYASQTQTNIIAQMRQNYSATDAAGNPNPNSKPAYLASLASLAGQQFTVLSDAYNNTGRGVTAASTTPAVVYSTSSTLQSATWQGATSFESFDAKGNPAGTEITAPVKEGQQTATPLPAAVPWVTSPPAAPASLTSNPSALAQAQGQNMTYTDYGYRVPSIECNAQNLRAQISLMDEQFAQFMSGQYLPNLESIFQNELLAIDMDVKRLQVAYLNTILLPPIDGIVTGIYKHIGDRVLAGETVMRIENTSSVYLAGIVIYRGMISLNASVSIQTNLYSSPNQVTIMGTVVAARGDQSGDDRWEVVFLCANGAFGNPPLPLNYNFDFDDTTFTFPPAA